MSVDDNSNEIALIVGSTRCQKWVCEALNHITGSVKLPDSNFQHQSTFSPLRTVSIDIGELTEDLNDGDYDHIVADASTYNVSEDVTLHTVYMELFPSLSFEGHVHGDDELALLLMPRTIANLARNMRNGSKLVIEHHPHMTMQVNRNERDDHVVAFLQEMNPFHATVYIADFMLAFNVCEEMIGDSLDVKRAPTNNNILIIYKRINPNITIDDINVKKGYIREAINMIIDTGIVNYELMYNNLNNSYCCFISDAANFIKYNYRRTICAIIDAYVHMISKQDDIRNWLTTEGFVDISIDYRKNDLNGRDNCWMITAEYNGNEHN